MAETTPTPASALQCALIMVDVLGFKNKLSGPNRAVEFQQFVDAAREVLRIFGHQRTGDIQDLLRIEGQHTLLYSDTFLFYQPVVAGMLPVDALVSAATFAILITATGLEKGLLMRGAISFGELLVSSQVPTVAGPVVNECAEHYESTQWVGCHTTPSAAAVLDATPPDRRRRVLNFFERTTVPFQLAGGAILSGETWAARWHRHLRDRLPADRHALPLGPLRTRMEQYERENRPLADAVTDYFRDLLHAYAQSNPAATQKVQNTLAALF